MTLPSPRERAKNALVEFFGEAPALEVGDDDVRAVAFLDEDEEDGFTWFFATTGVSQRPLAWAPYGVELIVVANAELEEAEARALLTFLVSLGKFLRTSKDEPQAGMILSAGGIPVFDGMTSLFLGRWDTEDATDGITFLSACPLFDDESQALVSSGMDEDQVLAWLDEHGVDADDPFRSSVFQAREANEIMAKLASGDAFAVSDAVNQLSRGIAQTMITEAEKLPKKD